MNHASARAFCVPHLPFISIQDRALNAPFWKAYDAGALALRDFDPQLVFCFGSDHYEGQMLQAMPAFALGTAAESVPDRGGFPGPLNVPGDIAWNCAQALIEDGFDLTVSHEMRVDHGFSNVLFNLFGGVGSRPVVPLFINALAAPRPSFARCRALGAAVGRFAAGLGLRVAFVGSGGLSHETGDIFPQLRDVQDSALRDFLLTGGARGPITREFWRTQLHAGLTEVNKLLEARVPGTGDVRPAWDRRFLELISRGDLSVFDSWRDAEVLREGGNGAGEVRSWIAALSAAQVAGAAWPPVIDYYGEQTCLGVAAVVVHAGAGSAA